MSTSKSNYPSVLLPADRAAFAAVVAHSHSPSPSSPSSTTADPTTTTKQEWPPVYAHPSSQSMSQTQSQSQSQSQSQFESQSQAGTMDNPLIPKRRRRTSPDELRILEAEFQANPLPSQAQRAALSARLGMTGRALQVWFQNRRQKEKKDAGTYLGTSGDSSEGSATDQDRDAADLEGLSFAMSSSPSRPSPTVLHHTHTQVKGHHRGGSYLDAKALESLPSSEQIYRRPDADKENQAVPTETSSSSFGAGSARITMSNTANGGLPSVLNNASGSAFHTWHISAANTAPIRHTFTIPAAVSSSVTPPLPVYVVKPTSETHDHFQHRASTTSVIAAKKHVKRRPLGSHAPTARKPSLPHSFNFPSSPDAAAASSSAASKDGRLKAPVLRRTVSNVSINSNTSESFSLQTSECGRASAVWLESQQAQRLDSPTSSTFPASSALTATPTVLRGFKSHDKEVWQLMQSDAPSSPNQSPAPLTRKMMLAHAQAQAQSAANETKTSRHMMLSSEDAPSSDVDVMYDDQPALATAASINARSSRRPNPIRSFSLGGTSTLQTSRAGGEEACAISALERKRQRVLEKSYSAVPAVSAPKSSRRGSSGSRSTTSRSSSAGAPSRSNSNNGPRRANSSDKAHLTAARKMMRIDTGSSTNDVKASISPRETLSSPQESLDENDHDDGSSSMGDLSYTSTCTNLTTSSIGTPKLEAGGYFPLGGVAGKGAATKSSIVKKDCSNEMVDQERECAELLLGLGGGGIFC
ncbi:BQ2448_5609 [Microbotryum intermedium]|uniref:BQ2448_5609 protein n=1 Tax=Microbotryum intermedium TaxID=269621 RepID=A0A238F526_9BASI|nr:BQ2448_5609 [Microbotryum intermedium]